MENVVLTADLTSSRTLRLRLSAVLAAAALVLTMFVLIQQPADAAPAGGAAVAAAVASVGAADAAQINFNQIICAALISLRNAFDDSPFFSFVAAILNQFIIGFGCSPS